MKHCDSCHKPKLIWKNFEGKKYCKHCWSCHSSNLKQKPTVKSVSIRPRSSKKVKEDKIYSELRKAFLTEKPLCEASIKHVCSNLSTEIHHMKGRLGNNYLDTKTWLAVCRGCHSFIEEHPKIAKELNFSQNRK